MDRKEMVLFYSCLLSISFHLSWRPCSSNPPVSQQCGPFKTLQIFPGALCTKNVHTNLHTFSSSVLSVSRAGRTWMVTHWNTLRFKNKRTQSCTKFRFQCARCEGWISSKICRVLGQLVHLKKKVFFLPHLSVLLSCVQKATVRTPRDS